MELEKMQPYELELLIEKAQELLNQKSETCLTHHELIEINHTPAKCPQCGSQHFVKNGHHNGAQRYWCKSCHTSFGSTNDSFLYHTQLPYKKWVEFIKCEMLQMTLKQEAEQIGVSQTTCFAMRHKLHAAISKKIEAVRLEGEIQSDFLYKSINLKGTLPRQDAANQ